MSAHTRFLSSILAVTALMSASGCICVTGPSGTNGDISFTWTLNGRSCAMAQDVTQVVVQMPGQTLQNNGVYGCTNGGSNGIKLLNFRPGTYSYTIAAQNAQGSAVFSASGTVVVNGDVAVSVDLKPTGNATGTAYVAWTLPQGTTVTCQYLAAVDITIDNATQPTSSQCTTGLYSGGSTLQGVAFNLAPGTHTIQLDARDSAGIYYYRKISSFTVEAAQTSQQIFSLDWLVGTVPIRFNFSNGITQLTCAQAGVSMVHLTFRDAQNTDYTQDVPCQLGNIDGYTPYMYAGSYTVFASAVGTAGAQYSNFQTNSPAQPVVSVQAGVFPPLTQSSTATLLSL
ncbi:MAG: hypothetical protein U0228_02595 [Myxococcaceae bacterium]